MYDMERLTGFFNIIMYTLISGECNEKSTEVEVCLFFHCNWF